MSFFSQSSPQTITVDASRSEIKLDNHYHFLVQPTFKRDYQNRVLVETWRAYDKKSAEEELGLHPKEFALLCKTQTQKQIQGLFSSRLRLLTYQYLFHFLLKKFPKFRTDAHQQSKLSSTFKRFPQDIKHQVKNVPLEFPLTLYSRRYPLPNTQKLLPPKRPNRTQERAQAFHSSGPRVVRIRNQQRRKTATRSRQMVY